MSLTAYGLQCEHRSEPLGVDEPQPSFCWKLAASSPGRSQQAYRVTVRPDLAFALLYQEEFPSWGYSVRQGATTIWERWDGWTEDEGFQSAHMNSFNHYSLGSVGEWLWRSVAGIDQGPGSVAYRDLVIAPRFGPRLEWVTARYDSPRGLVQVRWRRHQDGIGLDVDIPPGRPAEVRFPASTGDDIAIDGIPVEEHPWARLLGAGEEGARIALSPGSWRLQCTSGSVIAAASGTV